MDFFASGAPHLVDVAPPAALEALLAASHERLRARLVELAPGLAPELVPWMAGLAQEGSPPHAYFCHPLAFPLMQLPWWLDEALGGHPDPALQRDLQCSSMCGYYLIRLIDDVMDRSPAARPDLLPAVGIFHAEFHTLYSQRVPANDPFWSVFHRAWAEGHEAAVVDGRLLDLDRETFERVSGRKVCAALIPLAAVAHHHGREAAPEAWSRFLRAYCPWHQLHNDLLDWHRDAARDGVTWFLCEGRRRRGATESLVGWVVREGFELGVSWLEEGLADLRGLAEATGSEGLTRYLDGRGRLLRLLVDELRPGLALVQVLAAGGAFGKGPA
jgi:hypothetical protein